MAARAAARAAVEKEAARVAVVMVTVARVEAGWVAARAVAAVSVGESSGGGEGKAMAARAVARAAPACEVTDVPGARHVARCGPGTTDRTLASSKRPPRQRQIIIETKMESVC